MGVKDLVYLYESSAPTARPDNSNETQKETGQSLKLGPLIEEEGDVDRASPVRLARFIKRPDKVAGQPGQISQPPSTFLHSSTSSTVISEDSRNDDPVALADAPHKYMKSIHIARTHPRYSRTHSSRHPHNDSLEEEEESLVKHIYPPNGPWTNGPGVSLKSPMSYSQYPRHYSHHMPIPAPIVFARNAYPLSLPKLDEHLASLILPVLSKKEDIDMFPPLDQLAKTGRSLDDLETNATVAPGWRNRNSIFGTAINLLIGFLGSSALASFYSLQGLINTFQIFALILTTIVPVGHENLGDKWRQLFLGTIPNVLALNFAPALVQSLIFLAVSIAFGFALLYYFYRSTMNCDRYNSIEGLQLKETKGNQWGLVIVTFILTVIYLPLSTMSIHVLVWSEELWQTPNPYRNATTLPPVVPALGPPNEFRDPLDFCWTTTMKRNEVNLAPVIMVFSGIVFVFFTLWFPIALRRVISRSVPKVDQFTELGRPRSNADLDLEYHRLLGRDNNPFSFLYNSFRRGWGTYISTYLFAKLSTLLIVAVVDPDNCFFRSLPRNEVSVVRQSLLVVSALAFFIAQSVLAPFLDPVNNASEWTSRLNYFSTSLTALVITVNIPGKDIFNSYVLYSIYIITYSLGFYFSLVNFAWVQRIIKRLTRRIDFSIDIFSPRLDISASSIHTKRRIWQESITALFLTCPDCHIPIKQPMAFAQARDSEFPPYLLDFMGTPGERHVENIKILRDVGSVTFNRAVALSSGPDFAWYRHLEDVIQKNYIGPDSYWKKPSQDVIPGCHSHFGNAWWIPFPPTLVIRYDDGPYAVLNQASDLEEYIAQNSSTDVQRRRYVRMALRSLEGRIVLWPYQHIEHVGTHFPWCYGRRYNAVTSHHYQRATLCLKRRGHLIWQGLQLGSGFEVKLKYSKKVTVSSEVIGLNEDYDLTSSLAHFLEINRKLIDEGLYQIEEKLSRYRRYHRKECRWKSRVLTYRFMTFVYDQPSDPEGLTQSSIEFECDPRVRELIMNSETVFKSAYDRLKMVSQSEAATWWYIFWDDLWRRNYDTISGLQMHAADFNPHYRTSIAYTPLSRPALESFLAQRGLLHKKPRWSAFFHAGFLNKLYLRLNDAVFRDSNRAVMFHLGNDRRELDMEDIDVLTQGPSSTLGTGGGTDHDAPGIRARPTYRWEGLLDDPQKNGGIQGRRKWLRKLGAWFGVTPLWRSGSLSNGVSLDVKLENGRYVLIDDCWSASGTHLSTPAESGAGSTSRKLL